MGCNFDLDQEVWWIECDPRSGVNVRRGHITHISWGRAYVCWKSRKLFRCGNTEVELPFLYHSKEEAIAGIIARLSNL
jgi:hypothetical protein